MKINVKNCLFIFYFVITLLLFAFVNFNGATAFKDMVVPYLEGHVIVIHFCFATLIFIISLILNINRKIRIDKILICLIIKCVLDAIPYINNAQSDYFWYYAVTISSTITYFIFININLTSNLQTFLKKMIIIFGSVICLQVIYTFFNIEYNYFDLNYKSAMVIPYGGTNIIASILIPILSLCFFVNTKKRFKLILLTLFIIGIVLTKSRGGIFLTFVLMLLLLYISLDKKKNKVIKRFLLVFLFILIIFILLNDIGTIKLFSGYVTNNNITLNSLSTNRIEGWIEIVKEAYNNNLLFGVGMKSLSGVGSGSHNILLDLLYKCGIVGTVNYLFAFFYIQKKGRQIFKKRNCIYYVMVMVIYANSLFEVCYFSYECDVMLWMFIGLMMNEYYSNVKNSGKENTNEQVFNINSNTN